VLQGGHPHGTGRATTPAGDSVNVPLFTRCDHATAPTVVGRFTPRAATHDAHWLTVYGRICIFYRRATPHDYTRTPHTTPHTTHDYTRFAYRLDAAHTPLLGTPAALTAGYRATPTAFHTSPPPPVPPATTQPRPRTPHTTHTPHHHTTPPLVPVDYRHFTALRTFPLSRFTGRVPLRLRVVPWTGGGWLCPTPYRLLWTFGGNGTAGGLRGSANMLP